MNIDTWNGLPPAWQSDRLLVKRSVCYIGWSWRRGRRDGSGAFAVSRGLMYLTVLCHDTSDIHEWPLPDLYRHIITFMGHPSIRHPMQRLHLCPKPLDMRATHCPNQAMPTRKQSTLLEHRPRYQGPTNPDLGGLNPLPGRFAS